MRAVSTPVPVRAVAVSADDGETPGPTTDPIRPAMTPVYVGRFEPDANWPPAALYHVATSSTGRMRFADRHVGQRGDAATFGTTPV
jgi:hypothetical protein